MLHCNHMITSSALFPALNINAVLVMTQFRLTYLSIATWLKLGLLWLMKSGAIGEINVKNGVQGIRSINNNSRPAIIRTLSFHRIRQQHMQTNCQPIPTWQGAIRAVQTTSTPSSTLWFLSFSPYFRCDQLSLNINWSLNVLDILIPVSTCSLTIILMTHGPPKNDGWVIRHPGEFVLNAVVTTRSIRLLPVKV